MKHIRPIIVLNILLAVTMILTACTPAAAPTTAPTTVEAAATKAPEPTATTSAPVSKYKEAPMLADMVKAGKLDPVDKRMPVNPFVIKPHDSIGKYGQTLFSAFPTAYQGQAYETLGFYEPVLAWKDDRSDLVPNLLEAYEPSADMMTFKMTIRKGLRWSDGEPVTTADIKFAYDDIWSNKTLNPAFPSAFSAGGKPSTLNVLDDFTFTLTFEKPYPSLKYVLCREGFTKQLFVPSKYLQQFHEKYADKATLDKLTKDAGFDTWNQLFGDRNTFWTNKDLPNLFAWKMESLSDDKLTRKFVRNPYYFKTDTEGNQLPYLDYQQVQYVDNAETLKMMSLAGENEYVGAPLGEQFSDWPMYAEGAEKGDYRMIKAGSDFIHIFLVMPNSSSTDPIKGPLLSNKDFRIALSYAINRPEMIKLMVTVGDVSGKAAQQSPIEDSPYYNEELTNQYTEYNPDKANAILDKLGLDKKGSDGFRLGPDGNPLTFTMIIPTYSPTWVDGGNLISKYWKAVGLNIEAKPVSPEIWNETIQANKTDITLHSTGSGGLMVINSDGIDAYSMPYVGWMQRWGVGYVKYITSAGKEGVKPPDWVTQLNTLREQILYEADPAKADAKVKELLTVWKDNFPLIGISRPLPQWMLISNKLKNTPNDGEPWVIFMFGVGGNVNPCQFYKE